MEPTSRNALCLVLLSVVVSLTGNLFLGFVGVMTGVFALGSAMERSPDLIVMLAFTTALSAGIHLFSVLPFGLFMLSVSPERVCGLSKAMLNRVQHPLGDAIPAEGQALDGLGYPWNMTERAQGHQQVTAYYSPSVVKYAGKIHEVVCGDNGAAALVIFGLLILAFAFLIVLPMMMIALRLLRAARRAGGCAACVAPTRVQVVSVPRPAHAAASSSQARFDPKIPIANAVPVTQAASVRVAPTEMR